MSSVFFAVVAPLWAARSRPTPELGTRPLLRWQVVREIRPVVRDDGITVSRFEHHSLHWTNRAARRKAAQAQRAEGANR